MLSKFAFEFNESIRTTPFFRNYGRHPKTPNNLVFQPGFCPGEKFVASMQDALAEAQVHEGCSGTPEQIC